MLMKFFENDLDLMNSGVAGQLGSDSDSNVRNEVCSEGPNGHHLGSVVAPEQLGSDSNVRDEECSEEPNGHQSGSVVTPEQLGSDSNVRDEVSSEQR